MTTINKYIFGNDELLLYEEIDGYAIHISDFSFERNGNKYNIHIRKPGCEGLWYVFLINEQYIVTNNVWLNNSDKNSKNVIIKGSKNKPNDKSYIIADLQLLSEEKQKKLIDYVIDTIDFENQEEENRGKYIASYYEKHELICKIFLDSDEYVVCILKNKQNNKFELYCVNDTDLIPHSDPHFCDLNLDNILSILINKYMTETDDNFYSGVVYGSEYVKEITNKFYKIKNYETKNEHNHSKNLSVHTFDIVKVKNYRIKSFY